MHLSFSYIRYDNSGMPVGNRGSLPYPGKAAGIPEKHSTFLIIIHQREKIIKLKPFGKLYETQAKTHNFHINNERNR